MFLVLKCMVIMCFFGSGKYGDYSSENYWLKYGGYRIVSVLDITLSGILLSP
jgi:hypothetical protein